jgi:predicted transposase YbfD/YdcC
MAESKFSIIFSDLTDPRVDRTKRHKLLDIIGLTITAVLCGADNWVEVQEFGEIREDWLRTFLELPNGIPSHDTLGRVFSMIDGAEFESCFVEWVQQLAGLTSKVIAVDGKTIRGSREKGKAITVVSAWAAANQLVLGQQAVEGKSNEIVAIPELLGMLDVKGKIITIDAIGTQTAIAEQIVAKGGDYLLAVKANQSNLRDEMEFIFRIDQQQHFKDAPYDYTETVNKGHGRIETRRCWLVSDEEYLRNISDKWPGLKSLVFIESERIINGKPERSMRYFITSLRSNATQILEYQRSHWGIENKLHWVLDIAFNEDRARMRKDNAASNFSIIRKMSLNLLRQDKISKIGVKGKRLRCGWDNNYLFDILSQA